MTVDEIRLGSRRIITLTGDRRDRAELLAHIDAGTWKRRAARSGVLLAERGRLLPLLSRTPSATDLDEVAELTSWLRGLCEDVGLPVRSLSVAWPVGDRTHRRYCVGTDASGRSLVFVKVSTAPEADAASLDRESGVLRDLGELPLEVARVPRLIADVRDDRRRALVTSPLPSRRRHVRERDILDLLPLRESQDRVPLGDTSWAQAVSEVRLGAACRSAVELGRGGLDVSLAHGDLRSSNVVRAGRERWIFDWEYAAADAPAATDRVAIALNAVTAHKAPDALDEVVTGMVASTRAAAVPTADVLLALVYLATVGHPWASLIVARTDRLPD